MYGKKALKTLALLLCVCALSLPAACEEYSKPLAGRINDFLVRDDWKFSFDQGSGVFTFNLTIKGNLKTIRYTILVHPDCFTVYAASPVGVDAGDKAALAKMAEFVCRANYGLRNGNFELDFRDGELRYKSFVDCDGVEPSDAVIRDSIFVTSSMFERYSPGILDVIFNGASAEDAVAKCER